MPMPEQDVILRCAKCGRVTDDLHPWGGHLDSINRARMQSLLPLWCRLCVLKAQLDYARTESARLIARIPELEREIAKPEEPADA